MADPGDGPGARTAMDRRRTARVVEAAIRAEAPLLALALHRCAQSRELSWNALAAAIGTDPDTLNRAALAPAPARGSLNEEVQALAGRLDIPADNLVAAVREGLSATAALVAERRSPYRVRRRHKEKGS